MKENYDEKNYDPEVERLADLLARVTKRVLLPVAIVIALVVVVLLVGCHKENTSEATLSAKVTVTVNDFTISQEDFPGAKTSPASYSGVKAMTLAFFDAQGNEIYNTERCYMNLVVGGDAPHQRHGVLHPHGGERPAAAQRHHAALRPALHQRLGGELHGEHKLDRRHEQGEFLMG